ncbi:diacylglycerol/lipid kinase family protein [Amnibacterium kyonggiense]|uniref:Diacylglycerol kinase n=1 Tax=Amnibacterium kyonggiense TaxID=595671 RepID=A0A4R7FKU2_9MICO|nr:YegS/Rv2252/BmrU family lipid kinase [Amnibacterium kyonggiense]TDS76986.1 diacylglycerol kinase [Amnibacterium kyonggiense]
MAARLVIAVNATAGSGRAARVGERAEAALRAAGHAVRRLEAGSPTVMEASIRAAIATGDVDGVVVVGGDGAIHHAVNAVVHTGVPLGIVAAGSGNDVARCLDLPHDDPDAGLQRVIAALAGERPAARAVDAVRVSTGRWFVGMLSAGFDAAVNERANGMQRLQGTPRYVVAVLLEVVRLHARRYRITIDRDTRRLAAVLVTVGNTASIGGGMRLAPDAKVDDGLLDVLVATPLSRMKLLRLLPKVFTGRHVDDEHVSIERGRVVTIDVDDRGPVPVTYADGERFGPLPVTLEVVPGALLVLT